MRRGKFPISPFISRIKARSDEYEIDRRVEKDGSSYGGGYDYEESATTASLYLYDPSVMDQVVITGEQQQGSLQGLCLPSEDIQVHDRLSYGSGRYEVTEPIEGLPDTGDVSILQFSLERVSASGIV